MTSQKCFSQKNKKRLDISHSPGYYIQANARVVELADSLDSGSSVHYARAGSSPASRTTENARNHEISGVFLTFALV